MSALKVQPRSRIRLPATRADRLAIRRAKRRWQSVLATSPQRVMPANCYLGVPAKQLVAALTGQHDPDLLTGQLGARRRGWFAPSTASERTVLLVGLQAEAPSLLTTTSDVGGRVAGIAVHRPSITALS